MGRDKHIEKQKSRHEQAKQGQFDKRGTCELETEFSTNYAGGGVEQLGCGMWVLRAYGKRKGGIMICYYISPRRSICDGFKGISYEHYYISL